MSKDEVRCVKNVRCPVTVGELYRWILAKLSDKDIKRALHKYRDLMPRQSDWNRKLTQATNVPEIGFRYLFRCGQIDESNHRTMQKMLKYIDRQDVLPYFDTILYNTNMSNASIDQLKESLRNNVIDFIKLCDSSEFNEVKIGDPYTIAQCQPQKQLRMTRSVQKRLSTGECSSCLTFVKKIKLDDSINDTPKNKLSIYELNETKLNKELMSESFSNKILTALRQARHRHRNTPFISQFTLTGVLETPVQLLLRSKSYVKESEIDELTELYNSQSSPSRFSPITNNSSSNTPSTVNENESSPQPGTSSSHNASFSPINKKKCDTVPIFFHAKLKVVVRVDLIDDLRQIDSNRSDPLERQMHLLRQTYSHLRNQDRTADEVIIEVRCTSVEQVDLLWNDYLSGNLKKHLNEMINLHTNQSSPYYPFHGRQNQNIHQAFNHQMYGSPDVIPSEQPASSRGFYPSSPSSPASSSVSSSSSTHSNSNSNRQDDHTTTTSSHSNNNRPTEYHVFISQHEYESCRNVLMRNLYPMSFYLNYFGRVPSVIAVKNNRMNTPSASSGPAPPFSFQSPGSSAVRIISPSNNTASTPTSTSDSTRHHQSNTAIFSNTSTATTTSATTSSTTPVSIPMTTNSTTTTLITGTSTNTTSSAATTNNTTVHHRFSAVQQLMARLRDVSPQFSQQQQQQTSIGGGGWQAQQNITSSPPVVTGNASLSQSNNAPTTTITTNQFIPQPSHQHVNATTQTAPLIHTSTSTPQPLPPPPPPATQISIANRPVLMHMFYPHESLISYTVNPLLSPIQVVSSNAATNSNRSNSLDNATSTPISSGIINTTQHTNIGTDTNINNLVNSATNTSHHHHHHTSPINTHRESLI